MGARGTILGPGSRHAPTLYWGLGAPYFARISVLTALHWQLGMFLSGISDLTVDVCKGFED